MQIQNILIIQTAFIGDVVLATSVLEKLHKFYPDSKIDFLVRNGNESLLTGHPFLNKVLVWNKTSNKMLNSLAVLRKIRHAHYDLVVNLQRYTSSGLFTAFSGATQTVGFASNPMSFLFDKKIPHRIGTLSEPGNHEIERCLSTVSHLTDDEVVLPRLYPSKANLEKVKEYKSTSFVTISPASVWTTKQTPLEVWKNLIDKTKTHKIYLLGSPGDINLCLQLKDLCSNPRIEILAGKLTLLDSAALVQDAEMNFTNDSAMLHICTAIGAPVRAVFCSTIPEFGFGPYLPNGKVVQVKEPLSCKPCGTHGKKQCPEKHFKCGFVDVHELTESMVL